MMLTDELLDYLADKFHKEHIGFNYMVMFDDFVELWMTNKWEDFANACT